MAAIEDGKSWSLGHLSEELRRALAFSYTIEKLYNANILSEDAFKDINYFAKQDLHCLIHDIAAINGEIIPNDNSVCCWVFDDYNATPTTTLIRTLYEEVKNDIDNKWKKTN